MDSTLVAATTKMTTPHDDTLSKLEKHMRRKDVHRPVSGVMVPSFNISDVYPSSDDSEGYERGGRFARVKLLAGVAPDPPTAPIQLYDIYGRPPRPPTPENEHKYGVSDVYSYYGPSSAGDSGNDSGNDTPQQTPPLRLRQPQLTTANYTKL